MKIKRYDSPAARRSARSGKSVKTIAKDVERDKFMSAEDAKEYGLIDEVIARSKVLE